MFGRKFVSMTIADTSLKRQKVFVDSNPECAIALTSSMVQAASQEKVTERQVYVDHADNIMSAIGVQTGGYTRRCVMSLRFAVIVDANKLDCVREAATGLKIGDQVVNFE
jgi:hypothetical protein